MDILPNERIGRNGLSPKVTIVTIPIDVFGEFRLPYRTTLALLRLGLTFTLSVISMSKAMFCGSANRHSGRTPLGDL